MSQFIVKSPIQKDGEHYAIGDKIDLTPKQAEAIPSAIEPAPGEKAAKPAEKEKPKG